MLISQIHFIVIFLSRMQTEECPLVTGACGMPCRDRRIDSCFLSVLQRTLDGAYMKPVDDGHRAHEGALLVSDWVPCHGNDPPANGVHDQYARGKRMVRVPT